MTRLRPLTVTLTAVLVWVLAACVSIPTSGPVRSQSQGAPGPAQRPEVAGVPPSKGAHIDEILQGYLHAMADSHGDFATARQYLTPAAAASWKPGGGATVYLDVSPQVGESSARLEAPIFGRVNDRGEFTRVQGERLEHDFQPTKVDGEWRLGNPPAGILLRSELFTRSYVPTNVYFFDPVWSRLVPQMLYLPAARRGPAQLVAALLRGPSDRLRPAVATAAPPGLQLLDAHTEDEGAVAVIRLSREAGAMTNDERKRLAAQIALTLEENNEARRPIKGMKLYQESVLLPLEEADSRGVTRLSLYQQYDPTTAQVSTQLFGISRDRVTRVTDRGGNLSTAQPLEGALGRAGRRIDSLAVSMDAGQVALVTEQGTKLLLGPLEGREPEQIFVGNKLLRPQFTRFGEVWTIGATGSHPQVVRALGGRVEVVPSPALEGIDISSFRISPDGVRVAISGTRDGAAVIGEALIIRGGGSMVIDGWRPLPIPDTTSRVVSVGWKSASELLVLATGTTAVTVPVTMSIDGSIVKAAPAQRWDATQITVAPYYPLPIRGAAVGAQGQVWRRVSDGEWREFAADLSVIAYPGG